MGIIFIIFTLSDINEIKKNGGKDIEYECINEIKINNTKIKIFRNTSSSFFNNDEIIIREEKTIFSGLLMVNYIYDEFDIDTVITRIKNNKTLVIMNVNGKILKVKNYK